MKRRLAFVFAALLLGGELAFAQEVGHREDLRFVNELRRQGYRDLAMEYLKKLGRNASPELARELPLEEAKTNLEGAAEEPDSRKRLSLYEKARGQLTKFLKENPNHPRSSEARLDVAQVALLQGRTQLSRALLQDNHEARVAEGLKARALLVEAGGLLRRSLTELDGQLSKLPEPKTAAEKAEHKRLVTERERAELSVALNLFDQAQTYLQEEKTEVLQERAKKVEEASKLLEKMAGGDSASPIVWEAQAWLGRCLFQLGDPGKARQKFNEVNGSANRAAISGQRLARYFRLLVIKETTDPAERKDAPNIIMKSCRGWLVDYPGYLKTPEGFGIRFLLAETLAGQAENPKLAPQVKGQYLVEARRLLKQVEQTENDLTDRARRMKIQIIGKQGGFKVAVERLRTFEDCYVRAQYEVVMMGEDAKKITDAKEGEAKRKERVATILKTLERGLRLPDAKSPKTPADVNEVSNAHAMQVFYLLQSGDYAQAATLGEQFALADPRAGQAAMAAVYALQAHSQLLAKAEARGDEDAIRTEREKLLALAGKMEDHWSGELAGDMARHQTGLLLMREKKWSQAVQKLSTVTPSYPSFAFARYQLSTCAFEAEKEGLKPDKASGAGDFRTLALRALESIPDSALGADPTTNHVVLLARSRLGRELFRTKDYVRMDTLASGLLKRLPELKLSSDEDKDRVIREQMKVELSDLTLYARYGLADQAYTAGKHQKVVELIDPIVKEINAGGLPHLKKTPQLAMALLNMALKSGIQLGRLDEGRATVKALQAVTAENSAEAGNTAILQQLVVLIQQQVDELRKKGDTKKLDQATAGFSSLLDELIKSQKKLTPEFVYFLARCYGGMEKHGKAADLLQKVPERKEGGNPRDAQVFRGIQLLLVQELRLNKETAKARKLLDEKIIGPKKKGWGARSIDARKQNVLVLEDETEYANAAREADSLVKALLPRVHNDNQIKEHYLECYYHLVFALLKYGQAQSDPDKKAKYVKDAAARAVELEKKWGDNFGSDQSKKRFQDLLAAEPEMAAQVKQLKGQ